MNSPIGLAFEGTQKRVFVLDSNNNRLTIYDGDGTDSAAAASPAPKSKASFFFFDW